MKNTALAAAMVFLIAGCGMNAPKEIDLKPINSNLDIKIPCKSAEWETLTTVTEGNNTTGVKARVYYRQGKFRFEILDPQSGSKQVLLMDEKNLYVLGYDNKAYLYDAGMRESEVFLRKIFVNTGLGRKQEINAGEAEYAGQKCRVFEYEILRNINGLYARSMVKEWRNKKGATVKMETRVGPAEFLLSGKKITVGPVTEVYETSKYKCNAKLLGMLFEVPLGMKIISQKDVYMEQMKKSGKKITADPGFVTMTVKSKK